MFKSLKVTNQVNTVSQIFPPTFTNNLYNKQMGKYV